MVQFGDSFCTMKQQFSMYLQYIPLIIKIGLRLAPPIFNDVVDTWSGYYRSVTLKKFGCFNHRVVILVAWLMLVLEANNHRGSFLVVSSSFPYS